MIGQKPGAYYKVEESSAPEVVPAPRPVFENGPTTVQDSHTPDQHLTWPAAQHQRCSFNNRSKRSIFICGLLLGVLVATITTSAILGGVLGSRMARIQPPSSINQTCVAPTMSSNSSNSSASVFLEDYRPANISTIKSVPHNFSQTSTIQNRAGDSFQVVVGADFNTNRQAAEGGLMFDMVGLIAFSFIDCLDACSQMNAKASEANAPSDFRCRSVGFAWAMKDFFATQGANCYLKNGTLASGLKPVNVGTVIAAKLLSQT